MEEKTERFVDESENPIPPRYTWDLLTTNQLIDLKTRLETQLMAFRAQPRIRNVLKESVDLLETMLQDRNYS